MSELEKIGYVVVTFIFMSGMFALYIDGKNIFYFFRRRYLAGKNRALPQIGKLDNILKWSCLGYTFLGAFALFYGFKIEPGILDVNTMHLSSSKMSSNQTLKIAHLTDLHIEGKRDIHDEIVTELQRSPPDLIFLTGDYVNLSTSLNVFEEFCSRISRLAPVFAVDGNWENGHYTDRIFKNTGIHYIEDKTEQFSVRGISLNLIGVPFNDERSCKKMMDKLSTDTVNIILTHTPDLIPLASSAEKVDFYFCGHTHGGQVRLPVYGALVTLCETGKKYEMGLYRENNMYAYTNRGVGMEGGAAPRVRFLAPPELAFFEISGERREIAKDQE